MTDRTTNTTVNPNTTANLNTTTAGATVPERAHHPNIFERLVDKVTGHHHHQDAKDANQDPALAAQYGADPTKRGNVGQTHQYGGAPNVHDNTYAAEGGVLGAHAVPPVSTHAIPATTTRTVAPVGTQTGTQMGAQTAAPLGSHTTAPLGSHTTAPLGTQTSGPLGSQTYAPLGTQTAAPMGTHTATPMGSNVDYNRQQAPAHAPFQGQTTVITTTTTAPTSTSTGSMPRQSEGDRVVGQQHPAM
ncbi:hypothetical protein BGZ98_007885 [Dissophora globulifera]|nr:hypothetical protein BGZ98_007885 [Dissophora globulifera]